MSHKRNITNYSITHNRSLNNYENYSKDKEEKPISSVYNIYFSKEKVNNSYNKISVYNSPSTRQRKLPIYHTLFYSPNKIEKKINYKFLFPNNKNFKSPRYKYPTEYQSSFISTSKKKINNTIIPDIYISKNSIASPKRCFSEKNLKNVFKSKLRNSYLTLTPNNLGNYYPNNNNRSLQKSNINSKSESKNPNIININLYNEKNNYIENNIINKIYMNKNRKTNPIYEKKINTSLNSSSTNNNESILLTERKQIPRRTNYSFYYCPNNVNKNVNRYINKNMNNKNNINIINDKKNYINNSINYINNKNNNSKIDKTDINKPIVVKKNSKRKVNNLPKVQRRPSKLYNESSIIKIQSIVRGYLLNKKLDKYLRHYVQFNNAIKIIEKIFSRKIFSILKENKNIKKNYKFKNIYYSNKSQSTPNNINNEKNIELQFKINELINEKKELQNNYENLKEFIRKYKELEIENQLMKNEINILKQKNNELLIQLNQNKKTLYDYNIKMNIYRRYSIQKQRDMNINIIAPKRFDIIFRKYNNSGKEIKKNENNKDFFTLGSDGKDNEDIIQEEKIINKLRILLCKKEYRIKFILFKAFTKFYYNGLINIMNIPINISNSKSHNRRYNNSENYNNLFNCMSIKTLSENSSIFTDRRGQNLEFDNKMRTSNFLIEDENKKK